MFERQGLDVPPMRRRHGRSHPPEKKNSDGVLASWRPRRFSSQPRAERASSMENAAIGFVLVVVGAAADDAQIGAGAAAIGAGALDVIELALDLAELLLEEE